MFEQNAKGIHFMASQWPLHAGRPTMVFIHGAGNSGIFWKAQMKGLAEQVNALAIDLPGHGQSSGKGMDRITDYARAVDELIRAVNAPSPIPCGLSMGGAITLQLLLDGNTVYQAGIVINAGARLKVMPVIFDMIKNDYNGFMNMLPTVAVSAKTDPSLLQEVMAGGRKCPPDVAYNDFVACNTFDIMDRLQEIRVPVLVLTAEEDRLSPAKYGQYLTEHIPGARRAHIMEAGHMSPVEKPEEVNRVIREFLEKAAGGR